MHRAAGMTGRPFLFCGRWEMGQPSPGRPGPLTWTQKLTRNREAAKETAEVSEPMGHFPVQSSDGTQRF